ncbi:MAG: hypothetical protein WCT28_01775 [Patescibacteria group bacterium]|jgi:hypothetical protein
MTSIELSLLQIALVVAIAPICAEIGTSIINVVSRKEWKFPWFSYTRSNNPWSAVAFGTFLIVIAMLPLFGLFGLSETDGNLMSLLALLALFGGAVVMIDPRSILLRSIGAFGVVLSALAITTGSANSSLFFLASSGAWDVQFILLAVAMIFIVLSLRESKDLERVELVDVRVIATVTIGLFLANFLVPTEALKTFDVPSNIVVLQTVGILIAKMFIVALGFDLIHIAWKHIPAFVTRRLVGFSILCSFAAIAVTLWSLGS